MKFVFLDARHAFISEPDRLQVRLAITSAQTELNDEATITVTIVDPDFKN